MKQVPNYQYKLGGQYFYGVDSDYPNAAKVDTISTLTGECVAMWVIPVDQWHIDNPITAKDLVIDKMQRNPMPRKNPCRFTPAKSVNYYNGGRHA